MTKNKPAALMSYAHSDDTDRHLTTFRERLSQEVQVQTGREFPIFQDTKDIQWGQSWQQRINDSLDEITFLIPIITPSFFNSEPCRKELKRFIDREKSLGRDDLILPVYFVETDLLNDPDLTATDELAEVIASRQYVDWRDLRFELFTNPQVRKMLAKLAVQIRDALPQVQAPRKTAGKAAAVKDVQPAQAMTVETGQQSPNMSKAKNEPPTCIVDPMLRGDFPTISEAIADVEPGTRILVRPGLYKESLVISKPLEIIGDGEPGDVVVQISGSNVIRFETTMGRLVNLTLRQMGGGKWFCVNIVQGRLEMEDCDITSDSLACVGILNGADPRLRRNRIHHGKDSGVRVAESGQGTLEDNDIFDNRLSGVEILKSSNPTLRGNRIHRNKAGGVYVYDDAQALIEDNDIFENLLSGVNIKRNGNPALRRNRIYDNKQAGAYVFESGLGTFEENDIFGNGSSGVSSGKGGNPVVRNNRINKNAFFGIRVYDVSGGTFEQNDLTENARGAWSITQDSEANVKRLDNKE